MRIVHAANYQMNKHGEEFANWDMKIHQGLVQAGHYVYPFSISDIARLTSWTGRRDMGKGSANKELVRVCENVHPDLLLLGHAKMIRAQTLQQVRQQLPHIKIALWYGDAIWEGMDNTHLFEKMGDLDAMFISTGGDALEQFASDSRIVSFVPNPVEPSIECHRAFESEDLTHDLIFFGRDHPERNALLQQLIDQLPDVDLGLYGCMGRPFISGHGREEIVARSRMALNLNRNNSTLLCSSNRLADTVGNGVLTFCDAANGLQALFADDEVAYYESTDDLIELARYFKDNPDEAKRRAEAGWKRAHSCYSARQIAAFIVHMTMGDLEKAEADAPWPRFIYGGGHKVEHA